MYCWTFCCLLSRRHYAVKQSCLSEIVIKWQSENTNSESFTHVTEGNISSFAWEYNRKFSWGETEEETKERKTLKNACWSFSWKCYVGIAAPCERKQGKKEKNGRNCWPFSWFPLPNCICLRNSLRGTFFFVTGNTVKNSCIMFCAVSFINCK
jgi:hypothetical protein